MNAPDYIEQDTYKGRHTITSLARGQRVTVWSAGELSNLSKNGVIFESFGRVNGRENFARTRYVADSEGNLHCYDSEGVKKCVHPADRKLRIITR